jgi:hypothetical protein
MNGDVLRRVLWLRLGVLCLAITTPSTAKPTRSMLAACGLTRAVTASMVGASALRLLENRQDALLYELGNLHHVARGGRRGALDAIVPR